MNTKLCCDCIHFEPDRHSRDDGSCTHPKAIWVHIINGEVRKGSAFSQRMSVEKDRCGIHAQYWSYNPGSPPEPETSEDSAF